MVPPRWRDKDPRRRRRTRRYRAGAARSMATRAGRSRFADADAQSSCGESRVPRGRVARGYASIAPAARLGAVVFARPRKETQADAAASASPLTPAPASTLSRRRAVSSPFASSLTYPAAARDHRSSRAWEGGGVLRCVASPRAEELWASASAWSVEGPGHLRKLAPPPRGVGGVRQRVFRVRVFPDVSSPPYEIIARVGGKGCVASRRRAGWRCGRSRARGCGTAGGRLSRRRRDGSVGMRQSVVHVRVPRKIMHL